jgi:HEAT repeat protein
MAFTGMGKPDVDKLMSKRDVEGLIDALDYKKDTNVRSRAAQALGDVFDGRVVDALGKALKDEDAGVRMDALNALGRVKVPHSMEVLAPALKDPDPGIRSLAQKMLISHVHSLKVEPDVDGLVMAMKSEDIYIRLNAVSALGEVGDERAVEALAATCLRDPYYPIRFEAAESLRKVGDNRTAGILADSLQDDDRTVRLRAAEALGKIGDRRSVSALSAAMEDEDDAVRAAAMSALGKIGDPRVMNMIVAAMKRQAVRGP